MSSLVILAASVLGHRAEKLTDTQTNGGKNPTAATAAGVGKKSSSHRNDMSPTYRVDQKRAF